MLKKRYLLNIAIILFNLHLFNGCGNKQEQVSLVNPMDEAGRFAKTIYGENASLTLKGDLNADGNIDALALVINRKIDDMTFWIQKGGIVEKESDGWKVIFSMGDKLYSSKGPMIDQMEAKFGYILQFDMTQNPVSFRIKITDANGNPSSDEYLVMWNKQNELYEVVSRGTNPKNNAP